MRAIFRGRFVADSLHGIGVDGAVVIDDGRIVDVGSYKDIARHAGSGTVREYDGILCPALINAHTHLELSALRKNQFRHDDFVDWVIKLVDTRASMLSVDLLPDCSREKREAESKGTCYFVNVGNDFEMNMALGSNQLFEFEQIGINDSVAGKIFERSSGMLSTRNGIPAALAVHAPYSVSPALMKRIKSFNNSRGSITSIHLAETSEEAEFVKSGTGRMADLLNYRVGSWEFEAAGVSPVKYADSLGMLDEKTLCVHCVFLDEDDINIMKKRGSAVAVCVRSNLELSGKTPPVGKFLENGLRVLIGTDSRASSPDIDMFSELAAFYSEFHGVISPEQVFRAATSDAAEFLGIAQDYGSISPGRKASIVYVPFEGRKENVYEYLVSASNDKTIMVES
ncbi:MAG: amidohydrolase family protein [Bacteroidetes bacterium]|nr:amidohydrolase family protein [Bacteroidota bacterium]